MVTMQLVVVSAVSAAVAAAMRIRRIASQTEFFFIIVNLFYTNVHYYLGRYAQNLTLYERKSISKFINSYL